MTGQRLLELMRQIGWTNTELARRLNVSEGTVRAWLRDRRAAPPQLAAWMEERADVRLMVPNYPTNGGRWGANS